MNLLALIGQIFKPAAELIDNMHTSTEEKLNAKVQLMEVHLLAAQGALEFETSRMQAQKEIIMAETKSESWITRNWRPVTMLAFVSAILGYWFGLTPEGVPEEAVLAMFSLVKIGLGGYVVGRSAEKIIPGVVAAFKKKDET